MTGTANLQDKKLALAKLRREAKRRLSLAFDGSNPESRATPAQASILEDTLTRIFWVVSGNRAGKSQLGSRVVSWWFNGDHPHMQRPASWGSGPLQLLVVGRLGEQMESELWEKKLKPFMQPGTYRAVRIGNILQRVEHLRNGNRIIFLSHHDAVNARPKVQAFTANVVWLDEMPDHAGLVTELVTRAVLNDGRLYGTFTPLIRNEEIRKIVDSPAPGVRKCQLNMLDNPLVRGREAEITAQMRASCSSDAEFRARMYGEWYYGDARVCKYDAARHKVSIPDHYGAMIWRHMAVVDPSASGLTGLTILGEDPVSGRWLVVKAKYLRGTAAYDLVDNVEAELVGYRVLWRRCDCNPAGFYKEAARRGLAWVPYTEKQDRKVETIDAFNAGLETGKIALTEAAYLLEDELVKASWSTTSPDKIAGASQYHLFDCIRYAYDARPPFEAAAAKPSTQDQIIRDTWKRRKAAEAAAIQAKISQRRLPWMRHSSWRRSLSLGH